MATLNLFQIVSKQLKETTFVSLEDTHKQLDMVRGAQVPGRQAGRSQDGSAWVEERHDSGSGSQVFRIAWGLGLVAGPRPRVLDSVDLR